MIVKDVLIKKEKENAKLRIGGGSWTINLDRLPEEVQMFVYHTEKFSYIITRERAFKKGFTRVLGGENKLVVPLEHWKRTTHERAQRTMTDLRLEEELMYA